jgi:glycosyltransferase involved in cell wall biosynthesis
LERYNNIFIFCVGPTPHNVIDDEHYKEEQELLNMLSDNKYFTNLPALKHDELSKIYKISDIIVFPTYGEQHPLVALKTISSNTILISTNDFSLPEIIENNYSGFLIDNPKDENEIISIIDKIIKDVNNFNYIKKNASKIAIEKFEWKISTSKLEKIYHEVIGEEN